MSLNQTSQKMQLLIRDGIRNIVKGHLVGNVNSDRIDLLAVEVTESIERYLDKLLQEIDELTD